MAFTPVSHFSSALLKRIIAATFISAGFLVAAPAQASVLIEPRIRQDTSETPSSADTGENIVDVTNSTGAFSTLSAAVQAANLGAVLSAEGPFTVFAPTNDAFAALPASTLDTLLLRENQDLLVKLLYNHVGYGNFTSDELNTGNFNTFDGTVAVNVAPNGVTVDGANVVQADVAVTNGVVHAIDQVLLPAGFTEQLAARMVETSTASTVSPEVSPTGESSSAEPSRTSRLQQTIIDRSATPTPPAESQAASPISESQPPESEQEIAEPEPTAQEPIRGLW
ncbi:MAG: fasciclin domain-containing protein [Cyanobacteria bacterium P01_D01_bin.105]